MHLSTIGIGFSFLLFGALACNPKSPDMKALQSRFPASDITTVKVQFSNSYQREALLVSEDTLLRLIHVLDFVSEEELAVAYFDASKQLKAALDGTHGLTPDQKKHLQRTWRTFDYQREVGGRLARLRAMLLSEWEGMRKIGHGVARPLAVVVAHATEYITPSSSLGDVALLFKKPGQPSSSALASLLILTSYSIPADGFGFFGPPMIDAMASLRCQVGDLPERYRAFCDQYQESMAIFKGIASGNRIVRAELRELARLNVIQGAEEDLGGGQRREVASERLRGENELKHRLCQSSFEKQLESAKPLLSHYQYLVPEFSLSGMGLVFLDEKTHPHGETCVALHITAYSDDALDRAREALGDVQDGIAVHYERQALPRVPAGTATATKH